MSEICAGGRPDAAGGRITLEVVRDAAGLGVEVAGVPLIDPDAGDEVAAYRRRLIDALIPQATFTSSSETMAVRFVVTPTA